MKRAVSPIHNQAADRATPHDESWWAHRAAQHPQVREHRVAEVRAALEKGLYDSDHLLDRTIQRLIEEA
jgi:uncharacterized protein (DUF885 family)